MNLKKALSLALAVLMLISVLTGCSFLDRFKKDEPDVDETKEFYKIDKAALTGYVIVRADESDDQTGEARQSFIPNCTKNTEWI